jgi:hypothetical protein
LDRRSAKIHLVSGVRPRSEGNRSVLAA